MAAVSHSDSKGMYSWWWDSHISPKNSKWLQENLTDMDSKVKQMIKLIEEDADSFARRAEMYYKKRPELMKMVEEFYRAYRALAERYDHATGVIRQAHRTMAEAFPNQVPPMLADDLPATSADSEPRTPDMPHPSRAFLDPDELQKDAPGLSPSHFHAIKRNGAFTEESDSAISRRGLKQLNDLFMPGEHGKFTEGRARKGLNFRDVEESNRQNNGSHDSGDQVLSESDRVTKAESEILALQRALAKLEAEKEDGLLQYHKSLERLSKLELEVSRAQEKSLALDERANNAESEVQTLKEALTKLQAEREASLLRYQQYLEKISDLEKIIFSVQKDAGELNQRVIRSETESESLKRDLARAEAEKEDALVRYKECLETLSRLEERLVKAEEEARRITEQAGKAENEIEAMRLEIAKLTGEKEDAALRYQQCLEIISSLEHKLSCAQEEVLRLNNKIDDGVEKLKNSEQKCLLLGTSNHTLQSECESLAQKIGSQSEELSEKQKELGRLWTCIQEERLRFVEAETAFQTLQNLHSQSQEELRSLAAELHNKADILENVESRKQALEDQVKKVKEENNILNELKLSSSLSINNLQDEIFNLRQTIEKLEQEVELRVDERNALQQEIYCLKQELNDVNIRHDAMMEEIGSTGLNPEGFGSSVKKLQDENSKLKETCEANRSERATLLEKLEIMERLLEKNAVLENSLSDLNAELESVREKVQLLEETCQSLLEEKSTLAAEKATLFSELQTTTEKLEELSDKNNLLENSLFDVNAELEVLRVKSKSLEDSCLLLDHDKSNLISEKETVISQLNITHQTVKNLEKQYSELEQKHLELRGEKESALQKVEELLVSLYAEREEHSRIVQLSESQLADKELQVNFLQEDANCMRKEYGEEQDRSVHAQIEIFILQKCIQDLEEKNFSLLVESQRLLEASKMSERLISKLENENFQKQVNINSLSEKLRIPRVGLLQVLKTLDIDSEHLFEDIEQDQMLVNYVHGKLLETQKYNGTIFNESQQLAIENSVLTAFLGQLKLKVEKLVTERESLDERFRVQSDQFSALQIEVQEILEKNRELKLTIGKGEQRMVAMESEKENLCKLLLDLEGAHKSLQEECCKTFEEKKSLMGRCLDLDEEKNKLEEEIRVMIHETMAQSNISLIYQNIVFEKLLALKELSKDLDRLCSVNNDLEEKLKVVVGKLEDLQRENTLLKESFVMSNVELQLVESVNDELNCQIRTVKELLSQKENELFEAVEMFSALLNEKTELQRMVEDLRSKCSEATVVHEDQANQILKLSSEKDRQNEELECLCEVNQKLESKMRQLCGELEETKRREEKLSNQLHKGTKEIEFWEIQAASLYSELQISSVNETLFEGKVHELADACKSLEYGSNLKGIESERLKETVNNLEGENGILRDQLAAYFPAVSTLKDSITSLEMRTLERTKPHDYDKSKVVASDALVDFHDMQKRINAIEIAVRQMNEQFKPKDREIQELKYRISWNQENEASKHVMDEGKEYRYRLADTQVGKSTADIPVAENQVLTKDIILDQMSECSSYGLSRRETLEADDQMLELWETADRDGSIGVSVGKVKKVAAGKSKHLSVESLVEKDLSVDKLEISKRSTEPREEANKRKILEKLNSDAQKLANLQITVQDLMKKVEITEKSTMGKDIEYGTVKGQLEATEEAIMKLFEANRKLTKSVEEGNSSLIGKPAAESDESGSFSRRRVSEQARRGSEKIGRLQLEVQRLQFLLLKLDDEKESKGKTKIADRSPRVLLRDYLYGGTTRTHPKRKKKGQFCACVKPPTKGD
ncbi:hypothetical protein L6164_023920 [Bauhinia variegata]|uniref:Uncharacterized protein n=1 Tax=Bauhinia variegata TaxID=167791 RepID=A0ACB9MKL2_BAUVA|nr:hypothetical protein L6164_023920 [Bauhinia variegata]